MPRAGALTATAALGLLGLAATAEAIAGRRPVAGGITDTLDADDHRIAVTQRGRPSAGTPSVVVVTGAGDCQASWAAVAYRLADRTPVVTYDRAGLGWSARGPAPTADRYVAELQAVLDACVPDGPYVLVEHSLGGLIARLHARQHPERLVGLVQVDATPEQVADDPGVKIGFAVSGLVASVFKALASVGVVRLLLRLRAFPLYPEQPGRSHLRRARLVHRRRPEDHVGTRGPQPRRGAAQRVAGLPWCARRTPPPRPRSLTPSAAHQVMPKWVGCGSDPSG